MRQRHLPRILELTLDRQRRRDALTGIAVADFLEANLRRTKLFLSPGHPAEILLNRITRPVLAELVEPALVERALSGQYVGFPAWRIAPVHPGVVRTAVGLDYLPESHRFLVYDEAFLSFPNTPAATCSARRCRNSARPCATAAPRPATLKLIDRALEKAPMSPRARAVRAQLLRLLGRAAEAVPESLKAVDLEPENPQWYADLVLSTWRMARPRRPKASPGWRSRNSRATSRCSSRCATSWCASRTSRSSWR